VRFPAHAVYTNLRIAVINFFTPATPEAIEKFASQPAD